MARGLAPVLGTVMLVAVTVLAAATVGVLTATETGSVVPRAHLSVSADSDTDRITLTHEAGDTLQVSDLSVTITVDGEPLDRQPPVPFFAARGFRGGPTGPFNRASEDTWRAGQTAAVRLAGTNDPQLSRGARVEVTVATDRGVVASPATIAG